MVPKIQVLHAINLNAGVITSQIYNQIVSSNASTLGLSPVRFIQEVRLEQAVHLLRTTTQTPDSIAASVGYADAGTLRSLVRRRRNTTLAALRRA